MDLVFLVQIKELQLEVSNLQLHLYMAEERLRPDKCNNKFSTSSLLLSFCNQYSTANFEALTHGTNNENANPCNNMEGSNMNNSDSEVFPTWYQAFSSLSPTDLLSAFSLQPHSQQDAVKQDNVAGPGFTSMLQQPQAETTSNCHQMPSSTADQCSEYENNDITQPQNMRIIFLLPVSSCRKGILMMCVYYELMGLYDKEGKKNKDFLYIICPT
ncbi:hypothetical protein NC651_012958 [Populus alba x Populus x berolinensis]|nr:hypothetical protein NC651_012958 [Populus alba x Populus x berolinensis]